MHETAGASGHASEPSVWDATVGPFHDGPRLAQWLGVSIEELEQLSDRGVLLATPTTDGALVFPSFQFGPAGEVLPGLSEVLTALDPETQDRWGVALWLCTPSPRFGGVSAAAMMRAGDLTSVLLAAARDHALWER